MNNHNDEEIELLDPIVVKKEKKRKIHKLRKVIKIFTIIAALLSFGILIFSGYNIVLWYIDNKKTEEQAEKISEITEITEVTDTENTETVNPPVDTFDPYWDYINLPLINVNFLELIKTNDRTVAWIKVDGTTINYPVVQADDNNFYLNHSFDKSYNDAGWVFMDYRNSSSEFDPNTVIYAHSRLDKSMFWSLRKVVTSDWFNNTENHIVKLSTPYENTLWQVFSTYTIPAESYYITTGFAGADDFGIWVDTMKNRSLFNFNTSVTADDKILTLSSCYTSNGIRMVLHAKLIKRETRID